MALSSRALAFSVEALVERPRKRKLQDPREETQPELLKKEEGEEEERRNWTAGKKSQQPGKYSYRSPNALSPLPEHAGPASFSATGEAERGLLALH